MTTRHQPLDTRGFVRAVSSTVAPMRMRTRGAFEARFRYAADGERNMGRIVATAHRSRSTGGAPGRRPRVVCVLQLDGRAQVEQDGRRSSVGSGGFWWFRTDRPYDLTFESGLEIVGISAPAGRLPALCASGMLGVGGEDPVIASLGDAFEGLERALPGMALPLQARMLGHALDVIDTVSRHAARAGDAPAAAGNGVVLDALEHIDAHLGSDALSPASIALAIHVSPRTLHSAFERARMSVSATVRERRLERCRQDLADPALAWLGVAAIGSRWGFPAPSHFSALFRATYGMSPSAFRSRAAA